MQNVLQTIKTTFSFLYTTQERSRVIQLVCYKIKHNNIFMLIT